MKKWTRANYQPSLPLGRNGERVTACAEHIALSKRAAREGMVLLKNERQVLPLAAGSKVALFGKGTFDYVKGGGGSGDVTVSFMRNLYDGLCLYPDLIDVYEPAADFYRKEVSAQYANGIEPGMAREPELPDALLRSARAYTDTAIISISRFSGEGWDRKCAFGNPENKDEWIRRFVEQSDALFEDGDFYLSHAEKRMVDAVTAAFDKVIVVMNVGGMVDSAWFKNNENISSVLMAWQGGMEGGTAAAELLLGLDNPSGKLSDTFAEKLEDYPSSRGFHESIDYVAYEDDVYVGYRYFETIPGAAEKVCYPFGFGLSYTDFKISHTKISVTDDIITASALVTNSGSYAGREVIQVYYSAPQGLLGKPARILAGYQKTAKLSPGESQRIYIRFPASSMASYDDLGKVQKSAWILEAGVYSFYIGTDVRSAKEQEFHYGLEEDLVVKQLSAKLVPYRLKRRMRPDGTFENIEPGPAPAVDPDANVLVPIGGIDYEGIVPEVRAQASYQSFNKPPRPQLIDVSEGKLSLDDFISALSDEDLCWLVGGRPNTGVANTFGYGDLPEFGVPNIMTADGPAGLRVLPEVGVCTTAFPCATLLACTWDPDLTYAVGRAGGKEVRENNIGAWLTPAVNIHRSPLCGRNFEYYSEDPLLAGKQAAAMVLGIQSNHVAATVKHFAFNNKETNRKNSDSVVSERAAREIYLKAFEIITKEAKPWSIMTSYNRINGVRASECEDLLKGILREEWGFDGMVTTDWWTIGEHYKECNAGNDIKMGCGYPHRLEEAMEKGVLERPALELAAKHILGLILKID